MDQPNPPSIPDPAGPSDVTGLLREILAQLRELNENILLSEDQRLAKGRAQKDKLVRAFVEQIELAIGGGQFVKAGVLIESLADRVPGDENVGSLRQALEKAQWEARGQDLAAARRRVGDFMAVGSFDKAEADALQLAQRYPADPAVAELLTHVRREAQVFENERRDRMYADVVRLAEARRWRQALDAAHRYVKAYPAGNAADTVRTMLATIQDNARIEEVRELRDQIRDLIERRRYADAVEYAQDLIERFPDTRAAEELGRQMARLRELARGG